MFTVELYQDTNFTSGQLAQYSCTEEDLYFRETMDKKSFELLYKAVMINDIDYNNFRYVGEIKYVVTGEINNYIFAIEDMYGKTLVVSCNEDDID